MLKLSPIYFRADCGTWVGAFYGATVGSRLLIDMQGRQRVVFVRGLLSGATPGEARLTLTFMRELADLSERTTGMFVRSKGDPEALARTLSQDPDVQQVLTKRQAAREILAASELGWVNKDAHHN